MAVSASRTKIKEAELEVPQSLEEAARFVSEVGRCQREIERAELGFQAQIARLNEQMADKVFPLRERLDRLMEGLAAFGQARREEFVAASDGKKIKTVQLATGTVSLRLNPPSVQVRDAKKAVEALRKSKLGDYIRTIEEVDKEKILSDRDHLELPRGIKVVRKEELVVKPTGQEQEVVWIRTIKL